jgi:hypothetical protein
MCEGSQNTYRENIRTCGTTVAVYDGEAAASVQVGSVTDSHILCGIPEELPG